MAHAGQLHGNGKQLLGEQTLLLQRLPALNVGRTPTVAADRPMDRLCGQAVKDGLA
jgi:hypothetical protein